MVYINSPALTDNIPLRCIHTLYVKTLTSVYKAKQYKHTNGSDHQIFPLMIHTYNWA